MKCYHCGYEWDYKGASEFYCTCPKCMMKVNIKKAIRLVGESKEEKQ